MIVTPKEEVDSERALYGNDDSEDFGAQIRNSQKKGRKKQKNDDDCKVVHEKDLKKNGVGKVNITKSPQDNSKNPQPYKVELIPLVYNIIQDLCTQNQVDFLKVTLEITSSCILGFESEMDKRFTKMCNVVNPLYKYNIIKGSDIKIPHTEAFPDSESSKKKEKIAVTSEVNSWIHKYSNSFNIELSSVFCALVLYSYIQRTDVDEEARIRCQDKLSIFYSHIDNKIELLSDTPPEFKAIAPYYLDLLIAIGLQEKTEYIEHSGVKGRIVFIPDVSRDMSTPSHNKNGIFKKKSGRKSRKGGKSEDESL